MRGLQSAKGTGRFEGLKGPAAYPYTYLNQGEPSAMPFLLLSLPLLLLLTYFDLKSRTIPILPLLLFGGAMMPVHLLMKDIPSFELFGAFILSGGLFLLAWITHGSIGEGDGLAAGACALAIGFSAELEALFLALILAALFSAFLLITRKASRKDTLPFIPFLLAGHLLLLPGYIIS